MYSLQLLCRKNRVEHSFIQNFNLQEELPCELYFQAPGHYRKKDEDSRWLELVLSSL